MKQRITRFLTGGFTKLWDGITILAPILEIVSS